MRAFFGADREGAFVALCGRGRLLRVERGEARADALRLFDAALRAEGAKASDVDEIAVDRGPSGFSAVRRRVAVATALAAATGAKLAATGPIAPEEAGRMPAAAFASGRRITPLYDGEPNITVPKRTRTL